jgi:putative NIF3 family GTP cyclohydrolase 1 type 2
MEKPPIYLKYGSRVEVIGGKGHGELFHELITEKVDCFTKQLKLSRLGRLPPLLG